MQVSSVHSRSIAASPEGKPGSTIADVPSRLAPLSAGASSLVAGVRAGSASKLGQAPEENLIESPSSATSQSEVSPLDEPGSSPLHAIGEGLKSVGGAIADFFSFMGSAIANVAEAVFVTNAVIDSILTAGSKINDALRSLWTGGRDALIGAFKNTQEALTTLGGGASRILCGDIGGARELGLGILKFAQTPVDMALMLGGRVISAAQTLTGAEPLGRELRLDEQQALRSIFGDSIDFDAVRLKEGDAGVFSVTDRPFVHGNTIYMQEDTDLGSLVHEMTHVWQHQNGGTDYMSEAVTAQWGQGNAEAYDWRAGVSNGPWAELNPEQQGAFIQAAFGAQAFESEPAAFSANTLPPPGMTLKELNTYLQDALLQIRSGLGAP